MGNAEWNAKHKDEIHNRYLTRKYANERQKERRAEIRDTFRSVDLGPAKRRNKSKLGDKTTITQYHGSNSNNTISYTRVNNTRNQVTAGTVKKSRAERQALNPSTTKSGSSKSKSKKSNTSKSKSKKK